MGKETGAPVVMEAGGAMGAKGMCHKPLGLRGPMIIMSPFLIILTLYFVKRAAQSSSHSLLMDMREQVVSPLSTCPVEAVVDNLEERGTWTDCLAFMMEPFAAATWGPKGVEMGLEHLVLSLTVMKWSVAPESAMPKIDGGGEGGIIDLGEVTDA